MNPHAHPRATAPPDASKWRRLPDLLILAGAGGALLGLAMDVRQFAFSWLVAFLCYLSVGLGSLFLVLAHHLFDAAWSVPIRRVCEHLAALLFPWIALCFVPVAILAPELLGWMGSGPDTGGRPLLSSGAGLSPALWYGVSGICLAVWGWLAQRLRRESLAQDQTGAAACTFRMRRYAAAGIVLYAITVSLAAILWMQALTRGWNSTIYGVCYFAGCVWVALAAVYGIAMILKRTGELDGVLRERQFHDLGTLLLAFTVFHAYLEFSQYFILWNANLPAETRWYAARETGGWRYIGLTIVVGHFLLPFLALLRSDVKRRFAWMAPLCVWVLLLHYVDMAFNVLPGVSPAGFPWSWAWLHLACLALIGGVLARVFLRNLAAHAPYPILDPRLGEALEAQVPALSPMPGGRREWGRQSRGGRDAPAEETVKRPDRNRERLRPACSIVAAGCVLLILGGVAGLLAQRTRAPEIDRSRIEWRRTNLVTLRSENEKALATYGWIDRERGVVRLPVDRAVELSLALNQDPAAGRSNLLERLAKVTAKAPEKPNIYE